MISKTYPAYGALTHEQALVPAFTSITSQQMDTVADVARASGQEWDVQAVDDYDGYRFILLETVRHGDEQKSFFVAGTAQCLELFENKDERLTLIGSFTDMETLKTCLSRLLGFQ